MPNPKGQKTFHLLVDEKEKDKFDKLYPGLMKIFLNRAIYLANNDKDLFEKIFFCEVK